MQENDPNFPLYDPNHALYHHFYQDHLAEPQDGQGQGPVIGHTVSKDMVHWAHLPVAVWNDMDYDSVAIYTGSATIVNGVPTMVYPGLCVKSRWSQCDTGTLFAVAVPSNLSDPFLTNWSKPSYNPIVESVQRDPSTAWQTASGEWRFTNYEGKVFTSPDFQTWSVADNGAALWPTAECPDFFALPPLCSTNGCANATGLQPTHVHKQSSSGQDWYTLGIYTDGPAGSKGNWTPVGPTALQPLDFSALGSGMHFYASKSFLDPVPTPARRIYYGWALVQPASTQTLARVTTYHAGLQRLVFEPLPELAALRSFPALFNAPSVSLPSGSTYWLGDWPNSAGNQSEFGATFMFPTSSRSTFGVQLVVGQKSGSAANVSTDISISFDPSTFTANVTFGGTSLPFNSTYYMPGIDMPGGDYNVTNVNYTDPHDCQAVCTADPNCVAYTYVVRPPLAGSCCLKGPTVPNPDSNPTCTSGVKPGHVLPGNGATVPIPLLPGDTGVDVRAFVDNTFIEVFLMQGRIAITIPVNTGAEAGAAGMNLFAAAGGAPSVTVADVNVWHMNPIWVSPEEVLARGGGR